MKNKVWHYFFLTLFSFSTSGGLIQYFGGLLKSVDSNIYEGAAVAPWQSLGAIHPAGVPFLLYLGRGLGFGSVGVYLAINVLFYWSLFFLLERTLGKRWAWGGVVFFFLDPSWMMIRVTLWSELPFMGVMTLLAALLSLKNLNWFLKVGIGGVLFLIGEQLRHAGVFFFPALSIALGWDWQKRWIFSWKKTGGAFCFLATALILVQQIVSREFLSSSQEEVKRLQICQHLLKSLNPFPYCRWESSLPICRQDPERKYLNHPDLTTQSLVFLEFSGDSPILAYQRQDPNGFCDTAHRVLNLVLKNAPIGFGLALLERTWKLFGRWDLTDRAEPDAQFQDFNRLKEFDVLLQRWNRSQNFFQVILVGMLGWALWNRKPSPAWVFLFLGALGHAAGVSLTNSQLALRYMAIHKYFILICLIMTLGKLFKKNSRFFGRFFRQSPKY